MAISYTKKTWLDSPNTTTPLSAANLQIMDDGIQAACDAVDAMPSVRVAALTSDFSGTQSNTTLEDVTGLSITLAANEIFTFTAWLPYESTETADAKIGFTVPSGATMNFTRTIYAVAGGTVGATAYVFAGASAETLAVGAAVGDDPNCAIYNGVVINSSTAGNFQVQLAQAVSEASDIKMLTGAVIRGEVW